MYFSESFAYYTSNYDRKRYKVIKTILKSL